MLLNNLIQIGEDVLRSCQTSIFRQHNLTMNCVSSSPYNTKSTEPHLNICCFIKLHTKQMIFLQLVKKLFQQIFQNMKRVSSSLSPTIPTILTTRRSLPLSASRRTKRMLSQKERVGTDGLAW